MLNLKLPKLKDFPLFVRIKRDHLFRVNISFWDSATQGPADYWSHIWPEVSSANFSLSGYFRSFRTTLILHEKHVNPSLLSFSLVDTAKLHPHEMSPYQGRSEGPFPAKQTRVPSVPWQVFSDTIRTNGVSWCSSWRDLHSFLYLESALYCCRRTDRLLVSGAVHVQPDGLHWHSVLGKYTPQRHGVCHGWFAMGDLHSICGWQFRSIQTNPNILLSLLKYLKRDSFWEAKIGIWTPWPGFWMRAWIPPILKWFSLTYVNRIT